MELVIAGLITIYVGVLLGTWILMERMLDKAWFIMILNLIEEYGDVFNLMYKGYFTIVILIGAGLALKRKWLPAISLMAIALPVILARGPLVRDLAYLIVTGILTAVAWVLVTWWLKRENSDEPEQGALEAAG